MAKQPNIVHMIRAEIVARYREVSVMIRRAQRILKCLIEIALHPNTLSEVEYIDLLIQAEEQQGRQGHMERFRVLKDVRRQAELLAHVKDDKIFEDEILRRAQLLVEAECGRNVEVEGGKTGFVATLKSAWNSMLP